MYLIHCKANPYRINGFLTEIPHKHALRTKRPQNICVRSDKLGFFSVFL